MGDWIWGNRGRREELQAILPFFEALETELWASWMLDKLFIKFCRSSVLDISLNVATDNSRRRETWLNFSTSNSLPMYNNHNCGIVLRIKADIFKILSVFSPNKGPNHLTKYNFLSYLLFLKIEFLLGSAHTGLEMKTQSCIKSLPL